MSADNGIYIGCFPNNEYRVIHAMAIDNLRWEPDGDDGFNSTQVVNYFNTGASVFGNIEQAMVHAHREADNQMILEYGVSTIRFSYTMDEYVKRNKNEYRLRKW